jgi:hypothetical protein
MRNATRLQSGSMAPPKKTPKPSLIKPVEKPTTPSIILRGRLAREPHVRLVEITWTDATDISGKDWVDENDVNLDPATSLSVGYIIHESPEAFTVVALVNDNHYSHGITIPKGMVVEIIDLA